MSSRFRSARRWLTTRVAYRAAFLGMLLVAPSSAAPEANPADALQSKPPRYAPKPRVPAPKVPTKPPAKAPKEDEGGAREAPNEKEEKPKGDKKKPVKKLAKLVIKKLKKKDSTLTAFDVTMLDDGIAHVRMTGDCGRYRVRKMHFRGHEVKIDKKTEAKKYRKDKGPRSFIVDAYVPVFKRGDVDLAKKRGLRVLKRELEVAARCQVFKRKKWGRRKEHPAGRIELTLPISADLDSSQFKP